MPVMKKLTVAGTTYDTVGEASVTQVVSSGTKIATVSIDGTSTDLYAPGGSSVSPYASNPSMDGTASAGSSDNYARGDHVHPTDTSRAASSHAHGNITSGGDITATAPTIASGDKLIINDESASKVTNGPSFGTDTTKFLCNDGSWAVPSGGGGGVAMSTTTCVIGTTGWTNNTKTEMATGVTASNNVIVSPSPSSAADYAAAGIVCTAQGAGTLKFKRTSANTNAITVNVLILS